jgi:hypothetical protein
VQQPKGKEEGVWQRGRRQETGWLAGWLADYWLKPGAVLACTVLYSMYCDTAIPNWGTSTSALRSVKHSRLRPKQ